MILRKSILTALFVVVPLLLITIAMQFNSEINWGYEDFAIAALLLTIAVLTINFVLGRVSSDKKKVLLTLGILALVFIIWAELGVGLF